MRTPEELLGDQVSLFPSTWLDSALAAIAAAQQEAADEVTRWKNHAANMLTLAACREAEAYRLGEALENIASAENCPFALSVHARAALSQPPEMGVQD